MNIVDELAAICCELEVGVLDRQRIEKLFRESIRLHQQGEQSFHRTIGERCEVKDQITIRLARLAQCKARDRSDIAMSEAKRMRGLLELFRAKYAVEGDTIVDTVLQRFCKLFRKGGSYSEIGKAMKKAITSEEFEQYKKAKQGKPITATIESHFARLAEAWRQDPSKIPKSLK